VNTLTILIAYQGVIYSLLTACITIFIALKLYRHDIDHTTKYTLLPLLIISIVLELSFIALGVAVGMTNSIENTIHDYPILSTIRTYLSVLKSINYPIIILVISIVAFNKKN